VGVCAQLRWSATGMRSVSSALRLAKRQQHLEACLMIILLLFLQKQNLAFAVYLFGSVLSSKVLLAT
jgi:hypothetical protein